MRFLIYGAGAVGSYFGINLASVGHEVAFITRPQRVADYQQHPISVEEAGRTISADVDFYPSLPAALQGRAYDLLILAVKSYQLPAISAELASYYPNVPMILVTENGLGVEDSLIELFGRERVLACAITATISRISEYQFRVEKTNRGFALAPTQRGADIGRWLTIFDGTPVKVAGVDNYQSIKWSKALFNFIANATSAIINWGPKEIYRHPDLFRLEIGMLRELVAVIDAQKIPVVNLASVPARTFATALRHAPLFILKPGMQYVLDQGRGNKMPSFNLDLMAGKRESEVIFHHAALAEIGRKIGVATPINALLSSILLQLVRGEVPLEAWHNQPDKLIAAWRGQPWKRS